jgi:hypothetical protein
MREFTRQQWVALTPAIYLADGYLDADGALRQDFLADYATAASNQLLLAEVSPQELALTYEGIRQLLPEHQGAPGARLAGAYEEALLVVARAIRQQNNGGLVNWLNECAARVRTESELDAFMAHVAAVMRRYGILVAALPDEPFSSPSPVAH